MRISDTLTAQLVESDPPQVVIADDLTGAEIALDPLDWLRAEGAVEYFRATGGFPPRRVTCILADHPPVRMDSSGLTVCGCGAVLRDAGGA